MTYLTTFEIMLYQYNSRNFVLSEDSSAEYGADKDHKVSDLAPFPKLYDVAMRACGNSATDVTKFVQSRGGRVLKAHSFCTENPKKGLTDAPFVLGKQIAVSPPFTIGAFDGTLFAQLKSQDATAFKTAMGVFAKNGNLPYLLNSSCLAGCISTLYQHVNKFPSFKFEFAEGMIKNAKVLDDEGNLSLVMPLLARAFTPLPLDDPRVLDYIGMGDGTKFEKVTNLSEEKDVRKFGFFGALVNGDARAGLMYRDEKGNLMKVRECPKDVLKNYINLMKIVQNPSEFMKLFPATLVPDFMTVAVPKTEVMNTNKFTVKGRYYFLLNAHVRTLIKAIAVRCGIVSANFVEDINRSGMIRFSFYHGGWEKFIKSVKRWIVTHPQARFKVITQGDDCFLLVLIKGVWYYIVPDFSGMDTSMYSRLWKPVLRDLSITGAGQLGATIDGFEKFLVEILCTCAFDLKAVLQGSVVVQTFTNLSGTATTTHVNNIGSFVIWTFALTEVVRLAETKSIKEIQEEIPNYVARVFGVKVKPETFALRPFGNDCCDVKSGASFLGYNTMIQTIGNSKYRVPCLTSEREIKYMSNLFAVRNSKIPDSVKKGRVLAIVCATNMDSVYEVGKAIYAILDARCETVASDYTTEDIDAPWHALIIEAAKAGANLAFPTREWVSSQFLPKEKQEKLEIVNNINSNPFATFVLGENPIKVSNRFNFAEEQEEEESRIYAEEPDPLSDFAKALNIPQQVASKAGQTATVPGVQEAHKVRFETKVKKWAAEAAEKWQEQFASDNYKVLRKFGHIVDKIVKNEEFKYDSDLQEDEAISVIDSLMAAEEAAERLVDIYDDLPGGTKRKLMKEFYNSYEGDSERALQELQGKLAAYGAYS